MSDTFRCLVVSEADDQFRQVVETLPISRLPDGDVRIQVQYSSINYKDALAATGHRGVAKAFPHVPGIDAAGVVIESQSPAFSVGQEVIVTGRNLGMSHWGGWSEQIRVPHDWVLPLPSGLTLFEAMALGTAGFTAAQCVDTLLKHGLKAGAGSVVVSGASGGVGGLSIRLLKKLGMDVTAITGKPKAKQTLMDWGASNVISRAKFESPADRALLSATWAGGIDTVGGNILSTMLRSTNYRGCVAACGLAGSHDLNMTVYPFLLRGITLAGIDSAECPNAARQEIWNKLAGPWKIELPETLVTTVELDEASDVASQMLAGQTTGRYVIKLV